MSVKNIMKGLLFRLPKPVINSFYVLYNRIRYPRMAEKKMAYGELNKNKTIYIIRPRTDGIEGLMSLLLNVIKQINYAEKSGYVPVVDFKNYDTQYKVDNGAVSNVWDYFFNPVSKISLDEAYQSRNVILSGLSSIRESDEYLDQKMDEASLSQARKFVKQYICFAPETEEFVSNEIVSIALEKTLGLYLRGTDYIKLRPAGHPVQPTTRQAIEKADEMMRRHGLEYVFLVTEDAEIYKEIKKYFGQKLKIVSYDSFINNYEGAGFLSQDEKIVSQLAASPYQRGMNYLAKLIILSRCKYFVGGNTCGSWAAQVFSDGYADSFVFELGIY